MQYNKNELIKKVAKLIAKQVDSEMTDNIGEDITFASLYEEAAEEIIKLVKEN